jgi:hypothetical protein
MGRMEGKVTINTSDAVSVLKTFIQEDRTEVRIYRARIENVLYALAVASFAASAFFMGDVHMGAQGLRNVTILIDLGLLAVMTIYFFRTKHDLVGARKALKARQDMLHELKEGEMADINVFRDARGVTPDIEDRELQWDFYLAAAVVLAKMLVVAVATQSFV